MVSGIGIGVGIQHTPNKGGSDLYRLFANGEDGFLFGSFGDLARLFTASTGPTNVANDADPVGLALEDSKWQKRTLAQQIAQAAECYADSLSPANWSASGGAVAGLTVSKVGTGTDATGAYADYQVSGTATGSGSLDFNGAIGSASRAVASPGQLWRNFTQAKAVGGTTANVTQLQCALVDETAANAFISLTVSSNMPLDGSLGTGVVYKQASATAGKVRSTPLLYFTAGAVNITIRFYAGVSQKLIAGNHALQSVNTGFRPFWKANSPKPYLSFDGTDDRLVTSFNPGAACTLAVAARITSGLTWALGGGDSAGNRRAYLGLDTNGKAGGAWGANGSNIIFGGNDLRGTDAVLIMSADASTVDLYAQGSPVYTGAASGSASGATSPIALGAYNNAGTPGGFITGREYAALAINRKITASEADLIFSQFQRSYQ